MTMLSRRQLLALTHSLHDRFVLSVYLDGTSTDPAHRQQWRNDLDHALAKLRAETSSRPHADRLELSRAIAHLNERLAARTGALGAPGWVGFIGAEAVHYANSTPIRVPTLVVWEHGPHIAPFVPVFAARPAIVVLIDARKAEIFSYRDGTLDELDRLHAHHATNEPTHLGNIPRPGFHAGTRGGTGHDRMQRALNEGTSRLRRDVAARVSELADKDTCVLVAGTPQHRHELAMLLAEHHGDRLQELHSVDIHSTRSTLITAASDGCECIRNRNLSHAVAELIEAAGARGPAALGPETTRWALDQGRVQKLYVTPRFLGEQASEAEITVRAALSQDATIDELRDGPAAELDAHGGVGARLRYRLV